MNKEILRKAKEEKGITLIALVITIIVLLILAGVTMSMVLGPDGIIGKAETAKIETRGASVQEARDIWKLEQETDKITAKSLEEIIDDLVAQKLLTKDEKDIILGNEEKGIKATGQITIGSRTIVFKEKSISDYVYVGDRVDYHPQTDITTYSIEEKYSGYPDTTYNQEELEWTVFNIREDGKIELISASPTTSKIGLKGARGYNNGVYILNNLCSTLYSNPHIGATTRSLNIEDIQDKMKVGDGGKKAYETQVDPTTNLMYGEKYTYTNSSDIYYPKKWKESQNIGEGSIQNTIQAYDKIEDAYLQETPLVVTRTAWKISHGFMQDNYKDVTNRSGWNTNEYQKAIGSSYIYFLASRCTNPTTFNGTTGCEFGMQIVGQGDIDALGLFTSREKEKEVVFSVRPVVTMESNLIDLTKDYKDNGNKWSLIK